MNRAPTTYIDEKARVLYETIREKLDFTQDLDFVGDMVAAHVKRYTGVQAIVVRVATMARLEWEEERKRKEWFKDQKCFELIEGESRQDLEQRLHSYASTDEEE